MERYTRLMEVRMSRQGFAVGEWTQPGRRQSSFNSSQIEPSDFRTAARRKLRDMLLWFAKTLANLEINDIAALPPLF